MGSSILHSLCTPIIDLCKRSRGLSNHYLFLLPCFVFLNFYFHQQKNFKFFGPPKDRSTDEPLSLLDTKAGQRRRRSVNFEFAFNDADFSDRVLHIKIMDDSFDTVVEVKTLHICSLLLAGNSPFFHKLFKNGMRESNQRDVTLKISASEKSGVMEVLNFMYSNTLTSPDVLGVLTAADKYEASDCVRYCSELLQKMPMTLYSSLLYLELPSSVLMYEEVQPLIDEAKKCLLTHYKDIKKSEEEVMALPLSAFAVLLESDRLLVDLSGDDVYEIILKWARAHYPEIDKRREILAKNLIQFIRFRHMSSSKLKEVLVCPDLDREEVSKLMLKAFITMVEVPYSQNIHASNVCQVIKVEKSEPPQPHCVVYFDINREDCRNLFPSKVLTSQSFNLGGRSFYLSAGCSQKGQRNSFSLYLYMSKRSQSCTVDIGFEAMSKSSMKFQYKVKNKDPKYFDKSRSWGWGYVDLFNIPWTDFMSKECDYFIDGILHLRAQLTIKDSEA